MSFPETEQENVKTKKLLKSDLIGLTPSQYVLYRINRSSDQQIAEEHLKMGIAEIIMDNPRPGEQCNQVAVVKITPGEGSKWKGDVEYRVPQIEISKFYGDFIEIPFGEIKTMKDYNDVAWKFLMPPKVFKHTEFLEIGESSLSYRLDFLNAFFIGNLRVVVTGITNLVTDKPVVDRLLQFTGNPT